MIELLIIKELEKSLDLKVFMEKPNTDQIESEKPYIVFEKTSSSYNNYLNSATFAFQSYARSLYEAMKLNERLKKSVNDMIHLDSFSFIKLNSDYNFTDTQTKEYRYQAVFDIKFYEEINL